MTFAPSRLVIDALRLDRWEPDEVSRRVDRALAVDVGGFVVFGGHAASVAGLAARIRHQAGRDLWLGADLERGAGQQFRGLTELPPPAALAGHDHAERATRLAASRTAREALSVGVNWVLAPVLDLDAERENPIVATRSFGSDPEVVAALGAAWVEACQAEGALACAKHFPGHGRTLGDSHIELPVVGASAEILDDDLRPFRAVASLAGSMMIAHVAYPALGSMGPATASARVVGGLLRDALGFEGLIATDAMIMAGAGEDDAAAAVAAIRAGCDLVLYPSEVERTVAALERACDEDAFLRRAMSAGATSESLLARFPGGHHQAPLDESLGTAGDAARLALETIVDRSGGMTGWTPDAWTCVEALSDDPEVGPPAGRDGPLGAILSAELRAAGWRITDDPASPQRIVVLAATPRGWKGRGSVSDAVAARAREVVGGADRGLLVLLGHPRWLTQLGLPGICAWSTESAQERAAGVWIARAVGATP